jgi:hypothetical protein
VQQEENTGYLRNLILRRSEPKKEEVGGGRNNIITRRVFIVPNHLIK